MPGALVGSGGGSVDYPSVFSRFTSSFGCVRVIVRRVPRRAGGSGGIQTTTIPAFARFCRFAEALRVSFCFSCTLCRKGSLWPRESTASMCWTRQ